MIKNIFNFFVHSFSLNAHKYLVVAVFLLLYITFILQAQTFVNADSRRKILVTQTGRIYRPTATPNPTLPPLPAIPADVQREVSEESPSPSPTGPIGIVLAKTSDTAATPTQPPATPTPSQWGVAKQIDEVTWSMTVASDGKVGSREEIFTALNNYRTAHGAGGLTWDDKLAAFAQQRASTYKNAGGLDKHKGFEDFVSNIDNMKQIGFFGLGENAAYGYEVEAVHLIEWIFAGDEPHNHNQLDPSWTHVGVGVDGTGVDIIFGKNKQ